ILGWPNGQVPSDNRPSHAVYSDRPTDGAIEPIRRHAPSETERRIEHPGRRRGALFQLCQMDAETRSARAAASRSAKAKPIAHDRHDDPQTDESGMIDGQIGCTATIRRK